MLGGGGGISPAGMPGGGTMPGYINDAAAIILFMSAAPALLVDNEGMKLLELLEPPLILAETIQYKSFMKMSTQQKQMISELSQCAI